MDLVGTMVSTVHLVCDNHPLPDGWAEQRTASGRNYYLRNHDNETSYTRPGIVTKTIRFSGYAALINIKHKVSCPKCSHPMSAVNLTSGKRTHHIGHDPTVPRDPPVWNGRPVHDSISPIIVPHQSRREGQLVNPTVPIQELEATRPQEVEETRPWSGRTHGGSELIYQRIGTRRRLVALERLLDEIKNVNWK